MRQNESTKWKYIETIMNSDYFNGLSNMDWHKEMLMQCVKNNWFDFLQLIVNNWEKNKLIIIDGINYNDSYYKNKEPLIWLIESNHCNQEWIQLLFKASKLVNVKITAVNEAIKLCDNNDDDTDQHTNPNSNTNWKKRMLQSYINSNM